MFTAPGMSTTYGLHRALLLNSTGTATMFLDRRRSWQEVGDRVARFAAALGTLGVTRGDRVGVLMLNQDRYLELYLAIAWAGAVIVPLNIRWSAAENEDALKDCRPKLLVVDGAFAEMGAELSARIGGLALIYADDAPAAALPPGSLNYETLIAATAPVEDARAAETDLAGIFYTGGTTGRSKGVMLSHRNLMSNARNAAGEWGRIDNPVYLHAAPMFHLADAGAMYGHLITGAAHAVIRHFSADAVAEAIDRFKVTDTLLVPTMIQMVADNPGLERYDVSSLRRINYGASPMSEAVLDRAMARLPGVEFLQSYGMTELSPIACFLPWKDHIGEARAKGRHRSGGRPTTGVEVRIVDASDKPLPVGEIGEIVARGDTVMMGYWERPEETAKAVIDGWMHTGDAGYRDDDGYFYIVDRLKDMIISGGENIYSVEVERCLAQHPAVAQCAVFGIPDARWGEAVHATVMKKPDTQVTADELIAFCKERIAGYKCPRSVTIQSELLPMSGAGKILKREMRKLYWAETSRGVN